MSSHLFEVIFTSVGLFVAPLIVMATMAGVLALADRLFHYLHQQQYQR